MRRMLPWGLAMALLAPGCAPRHSGLEPASDRAAPAAACGAGAQLPAALVQPDSILLFGEIHGVQEIPAAFGEAVCVAASSRVPVEVGLEIPKTEQARIEAFLASPGGPADAEALTATAFWTREYQDGRSSRAMLTLLERLRALRAGGLPIDVFPFDLDPSQDRSQRDRGMADNIAAHVRAHPRTLMMGLTGEVHAWKTQGAPWNPDLLPMGWHLVQGGFEVRSLGRVTPSGTAWICGSGSPGDCGPRELKAWDAMPGGRTTGIELLPEPSPRGNDGMFGVASLTASPPARSVPERQGAPN